MSSIDATRLQSLFASALELPDGARAAFLEKECAGDQELLAELRNLLAVDARLAGMTARPIGAELTQLVASTAPAASLSGLRVGAFELREELGRGGMGSVYRAERVDGSVTQEVAIKFVRRELLDANTRRRFQLERQLMATLDHPNIARLLDASELADGTPYYVMEYVAGVPITEYCDRENLSVRERVALMRLVCSAVAEAHHNLIVHRDLKPGNILISDHGIPKLLDFGIAKPLTALAGTSADEETGTGQRYFSPHYAAPEQLTGAPVGVACDVYALGLLLYELLAGCRPFDFSDLTAGQIERLITEMPPPAPSAARVRTGSRPAGIRVRQLHGDLDGIVLQCLRKAANERYASVEQLEADLRNYLDGLPVQAHGGHRWYRMRKFVGRHRLSVGIAAIASVALAVAALALVIQNKIARHERDRAEYTVEFLKAAFTAADPARSSGGDTTARQILEAARLRLGEVEQPQPELYAFLASTIADVQLAVGQAPQAVDLSARASAAAQRGGLSDTQIAQFYVLEARALLRVEKYKEAEQRLKDAALLGIAGTPEWKLAQARLLVLLKNPAAAVPLLDEAIEQVRDRGPEDELPTSLRWQLAAAFRVDSRHAEGLTVLDETLRWQRQKLPEDHPRILLTRLQRLDLLRSSNRHDEARTEAERVVGDVDRVYGPATSFAASTRNAFAATLVKEGKYDEAIAQYRVALEGWEKSLGSDHANTIRTKYNLAGALSHDPEQKVEAERLFREVVRAGVSKFGANSEMDIAFRLRFGEYLLDLNRGVEALGVLLPAGADTEAKLLGKLNRAEYLATLQRAAQQVGCGASRDSVLAGSVDSGNCATVQRWISADP